MFTKALNDYLTFAVNTHDPATGEDIDADSVPTYRIYEDETTAPIVTGSMAKLDDSNTTGFYSEQIQITSGSGYEVGKCYTIKIAATVNGVTGSLVKELEVVSATNTGIYSRLGAPTGASVSADIAALKASVDGAATVQDVVDGVLDETAAGHSTAGTVGRDIIDAAANLNSSTVATAVLAQTLGTESYAADGAVPTLGQAMFMLLSKHFEMSISGTTMTCKKLDGTTAAMQFTLNSSTQPTSITRSA